MPVVVGGAAVDDVDDDVGVLDPEVLGALVQLAHVDLEGAGQPVHRLHVDPELGHGRLGEVVHALPRRLKKDMLCLISVTHSHLGSYFVQSVSGNSLCLSHPQPTAPSPLSHELEHLLASCDWLLQLFIALCFLPPLLTVVFKS